MRVVVLVVTASGSRPVNTSCIRGWSSLQRGRRSPTRGWPMLSSEKRTVPLSNASPRTFTATSQAPVSTSPGLSVSAFSSARPGSTRRAPS